MPRLYKQELEEMASKETRTPANYINYLLEYAMNWKKNHPEEPYPGFYWTKKVPKDVVCCLENKELKKGEPLYIRPSEEVYSFFEKVKTEENYSGWSYAVFDAMSFAAWDIDRKRKMSIIP